MYISKDLIRRTIIIAFAMAIYFAFLSALAQAEITAPKCIDAGQLAVAHSDEPATWTVFPVKYQTDIYIADGGLTCIFASPVKGEITIMAATVEDGKAVISQHTLYNGLPNPEGDEITPVPEPPKPAPEPEKTPMEKAIESAKDYPEKDVEALAETFDAVVSGIDRGTISTPAAARETFRALWSVNAVAVDPEAITRDTPLITELSNVVDNSTIETVRKDYSEISDGLKKVVPVKEEPKKEAPKSGTGNCPNGNCPTNNYRRWGW